MRYIATFHSPDYGDTMSASDVRVFASIDAGRSWLRQLASANGRYRIESTYADGESTADFMPCAGYAGDSLAMARIPQGIDVWDAAESFVGDIYAHGSPVLLTVGPRGGIRMERG
jgi:hypothetical protein